MERRDADAVRAERPPTTRPLPGGDAPDAPSLDVALVNNMPDAALKATERQFVTLLGATAGNLDVRLSFYALPEVPRTDWGPQLCGKLLRVDRHALVEPSGRPDRHGTEPQAPNLQDEPYWEA